MSGSETSTQKALISYSEFERLKSIEASFQKVNAELNELKQKYDQLKQRCPGNLKKKTNLMSHILSNP